MKKIFSPVFYASFLVPIFFGILAVIIIEETVFGTFLLGLNGFIEIPLLLATLGSFLLWFANKNMTKLEKLKIPTLQDHFRQSALFYVATVYGFIALLKRGYHGGLGEAYFLVTLGIFVWAIMINAIYLYQRRKSSFS